MTLKNHIYKKLEKKQRKIARHKKNYSLKM